MFIFNHSMLLLIILNAHPLKKINRSLHCIFSPPANISGFHPTHPPIGFAWEGGGEYGLKLNCMLGNSFYINWQKKKKRFHPRFRYSHDRSHSLNKFSKSALSNSQLCLFEIQGTWHIKLHHIRFDKLDKVSPKLVAVCFPPLGCWFALLISIGFPVMVMVLLLLLSLLGRNRSLNKLVNELKRI